MSLYLNKTKMKSMLRQIGQEAAGIAKAANAINKDIINFVNDKSLDGEMIESAKERFDGTYYAVLLMVIQTCDALKTSAEIMIGKLDTPFTLEANIMDEKWLVSQKERFIELAKGYKEHADKETGDLKQYYTNLYDSTNKTIEKYTATIQEMHERNTITKTYFDSSETLIGKLNALVEGINVGYGKDKNGNPVFTNSKTIAGINLAQLKRDLEFTYADDKIMKAKFDPVNMATGCYVYDKSFLKTEGAVPLTFEVRYNSTDPKTQVLGRGWGHNHDIRLEETEDKIELRLRAERTEEFQKKGDKIVSADGFSGRRIEKTDSEDCSYIYTDEESNKYLFNADGCCIKITDSEGFDIHYNYETNKLVSVDTDFGTGYRFRYEEERLVETSDLADRKIKFRYEDEKLISITDECGEEYRYEYNDFDRMCKVINARGTVNLINTYDGLGRVLKQEFPDEGETRFEYLEDKRTIKVTVQDGTASEYEHDEKYRSTEERYRKGSEKYSYDAANNKISETDKNGNETKYEYDERGNRTAEITALGDRYEYEYDDDSRQTKISLNGAMLRTFEYNENGRLTAETDALGRSVKSEYDDRNLLKTITLDDGSIVQLEHDAQGNISKLIDENGNEWKYSYDKLNRVTEAIDGNGNKESFEYNARSEITKMTNAAGDSRTYEYNESGKLTHCIDFDGNEEYAEYNELNKISKYTDKDGFVTLFEYDKMWNLSKRVDAEGGVNLYTYDGEGRLLSQTDANFNSIEYTRDANGNVIREAFEDGDYIKYEYDALNRLTSIIYKDATEEHFEYDALGNETKFTDAAGNEWKSEYNLEGELLKELDPEGLETLYEYDLRGRVIKENTDNLATSYEYDRAGNLTNITFADGTTDERLYDGNGNMTGRTTGGVQFSFEYDSLDRLTEVKRAGQTIKIYEYDKVGNRIAVTDALGNTSRYIRSKAGDILTAIDPLGNETHYTYDKCHRLIGIDQGEGRVTTYTRDRAGNVLTVTDALGNTEKYEYDCNNNVIAKTDMDGNRTTIKRNIYGDVAKIRYADSTEVEYSYDSLRRLKEVRDSLGVTTIERDILGRETKITDHKGREVSYSYDRLGNRTSITYPSGKHIAYEFDKYNRNTKIKTDDVEASISYDAFGRVQERKSGNILTSYAYDKLGRLSELTHRQSDAIIYSEQLSYDAENNVLSDGSSTFEYDELSRLIKAVDKDGSIREYAYDAYGNRASFTENGTAVTYLYDEANQLLSASNGLSFKYDRRGNVIEKSQNGDILNTYIYGANNRLVRARNSKDETATYQYNGLGFRVSRSVKGKDIEYILDQTQMYNNMLQSGEDTYIWNDDSLLFKGATPQMRDRLGSDLDASEFGLGAENFASYIYDDVSGTYFAQAREYMPETGRFAGRDILKGEAEIPYSLNEYAYCHNNPIGFVDYNGMCEVPFLTDRQNESLKINVAKKGAEDLTKHGAENIHKIDKALLTKNYKSNIAAQKALEKASKAAGKKPPAPQVRSAMTRGYNKAASKLDDKAAEALKKGTKASKALGVAGAVASVGYDYYKDSKEGLSHSKKMSNMGVNATFAAVGVAAMFIPGIGWGLSILIWVGLTAADIALKDDIQKKINSLD